MGKVVGGLVGGVLGNRSAKKAARETAAASRLGFDFLSQGPLGTTFLPNAGQANTFTAQLLGLQGGQAGENAFKRFRDSTGFNFRLGEGQRAITGSRAARGLLDSGATLKALNEFGQNIASDEFNNFLAQLGSVEDRGLRAANAITGTANTAARGGMQAADIRRRGRNALASGVSGAIGALF